MIDLQQLEIERACTRLILLYAQALDNGARYQVKRIVVKPGGRLSLQMHHHRAEHWVVVRGTARVTVGDLIKVVHENESNYIPIGIHHRLENPGKIDLELIEAVLREHLVPIQHAVEFSLRVGQRGLGGAQIFFGVGKRAILGAEALQRGGALLHFGLGDAEEMVRERPIESAAVVFGAGVLVGMLLGMAFRVR